MKRCEVQALNSVYCSICSKWKNLQIFWPVTFVIRFGVSCLWQQIEVLVKWMFSNCFTKGFHQFFTSLQGKPFFLLVKGRTIKGTIWWIFFSGNFSKKKTNYIQRCQKWYDLVRHITIWVLPLIYQHSWYKTCLMSCHICFQVRTNCWASRMADCTGL